MGIKFKQEGTLAVIPLSPGTVRATEVVTTDPSKPTTTLGEEPMQIIDKYNQIRPAVSDAEILVVYCHHVDYVNSSSPRSQDLSGLATFTNWMTGNYPGAANPVPPQGVGYRNKIFLSGSYQKVFTLPHELGHLLTNQGHYGEDYETSKPTHIKQHNLMRYGTNGVSQHVTDSKRLYGLQDSLIVSEAQPQ